MSKLWEEFSAERKRLQADGKIPGFMETAGYSMLKKKYVDHEGEDAVFDRYDLIAITAGDIATRLYGENDWADRFFDVMWKGWLSPSTPVLANLGTNNGLPVSCEGSYIGDSVYEFYDSLQEAAVLTQQGFGTSAYLGDIRERGAKFSTDGKANGVVPVFQNFVEMTNQISQGSTRRGSWAGYLEVDHPDFEELSNLLLREPANKNVGWIFTQAFIDRMLSGDRDALTRYQKVMKIRAILGKGYIWKVDTVNRQQTQPYLNHGLKNKASNLCSEITLFSDAEHSYTCVLSSLNLAKYDEWKDTDLVFTSTVFLDCIAQYFIDKGRNIRGLEKAVRYTEKARSLGLGVMGWHDLLQKRSIAFESDNAKQLNRELFRQINFDTQAASEWMSKIAGEPEWCEGTNRRNSHLMAIAPTMSTALIVGGTSQGIEPFVANAWNQTSAAGETARINPNLLDIMKERGVYNQATIDFIIDDDGSVQKVDWLSDEEKEVFKTAYEIDQNAIIEQASDRQRYIDQGQSLNLFFGANANPGDISAVHKKALLDPYIKGLYYMRSRAGVQASKNTNNGGK